MYPLNIVTIQDIDLLRKQGCIQEKQEYVTLNGEAYCTLTLRFKFTIWERILLVAKAIFNALIGNGAAAQKILRQAYAGETIETRSFLPKNSFENILYDDILTVVAENLDFKSLTSGFLKVNKKMKTIGTAAKINSIKDPKSANSVTEDAELAIIAYLAHEEAKKDFGYCKRFRQLDEQGRIDPKRKRELMILHLTKDYLGSKSIEQIRELQGEAEKQIKWSVQEVESAKKRKKEVQCDLIKTGFVDSASNQQELLHLLAMERFSNPKDIQDLSEDAQIMAMIKNTYNNIIEYIGRTRFDSFPTLVNPIFDDYPEIEASHLSAPVMKGCESRGRPFITFKVINRETGSKFVQTFFQRHWHQPDWLIFHKNNSLFSGEDMTLEADNLSSFVDLLDGNHPLFILDT